MPITAHALCLPSLQTATALVYVRTCYVDAQKLSGNVYNAALLLKIPSIPCIGMPRCS